MRLRFLLPSCVLLTSSLAISCKGSDDSSDAAKSTTVKDETTAVTLATGSLNLAFDGGSVPVGTTLTAADVTAPSEFAITNVPSASGAYKVTAVKDGKEIDSATKPFSLAITLTSTGTALADVEKKAENLCLLVKTASAKQVWRHAALSLSEDRKTLTVKTSAFGVYMAAYCGDVTLDGFTDTTSQNGGGGGGGGETSNEKPTALPFACYRAADLVCQYYGPKNGAPVPDAITECEGNGGKAVKVCPETDFLSSCYYSDNDLHYYFYKGHANASESDCTSTSGTYSATYSKP